MVYGLSAPPPWMVNAGIAAGKEKTLIVDCGMNYLSAKSIYGYAKAVKPDNQLIAINTEPHFDHIGGNCFFREMGIDIYGHCDINRSENELTETIKEYNKSISDTVRSKENEEEVFFQNTTVANPNIKIKSEFALDLGGFEAEVIYTPGHTKMNLSVFVPGEKVLYCGDTMVKGYTPNLEEGSIDDWRSWLLSLKIIESKLPDVIIPGHGDAIIGEEIPKEISRIRELIRVRIDAESGNS